MDCINIHATAVMLARAGRVFAAPPDAGVLIMGASGSGKSDLALRLIERGAVLVADDRVDLFIAKGVLKARPPSRLAGMMEVRGVGIVSLPYECETRIALAVELVEATRVERLPEKAMYRPFPDNPADGDICVPLIRLFGTESSAPAKVLAAAGALAHARFLEDRKPPEPLPS